MPITIFFLTTFWMKNHIKPNRDWIYTISAGGTSVDMNYGKNDSKEPTIAHDTPSGSKVSCIYSKLDKKKGNLWFCSDSKGNSGYTIIDPGSNGYCVDGESAVCPPFIENIPWWVLESRVEKGLIGNLIFLKNTDSKASLIAGPILLFPYFFPLFMLKYHQLDSLTKLSNSSSNHSSLLSLTPSHFTPLSVQSLPNGSLP